MAIHNPIKVVILLSILLFPVSFVFCQTQDSNEVSIEKACLNYIEGFYEGDTLKLQNAITPDLYKHGYWKDKNGLYNSEGLMSYKDAIHYAKNVLEKKQFVSSEAPKKVEILDVSNNIACAKITAWWGVDYMLLSKVNEEKWIIEQVLWEGPLNQ